MSKRVFNVLLCVVSLVFGGVTYIVFRPNAYVSVLLGNNVLTGALQNVFSGLPNDFLKYYFADFLWGFSLSCGLISVFDMSKKSIWQCCLASFLWGTLWEMFQFFGVIGGTGDFLDIIMYFFAGASALLINFKEKKK